MEHNSSLTTTNNKDNLPIHVRNALTIFEENPDSYYDTLPTKTARNAIISDTELTITDLINAYGIEAARAVILNAVMDVAEFFSVQKEMSDRQMGMTVDLIIECYPYFNFSEIKSCFHRAMASKQVYGRLDGNIILLWLQEFDDYRTTVLEEEAVKRKNEMQSETDNTLGSYYEDYIAMLCKKASEGDEQAISQLRKHEDIQQKLASSVPKVDKEAEFKEYYRNYINSKRKE